MLEAKIQNNALQAAHSCMQGSAGKAVQYALSQPQQSTAALRGGNP
jgi:hypothetical protein